MLTFRTAGESHGPCLIALVEGCPAGLALTPEIFARDMARRRGGFGRSSRMALEVDRVEILSGVRRGRTIGSPIVLRIENASRGIDTLPPVRLPRPGHADLAGALKFATSDARDILERASARETAARVAAGCVAKRLLGLFGIDVVGFVRAIGRVAAKEIPIATPAIAKARDLSDVYCPDVAASRRMAREIARARRGGDTLGGVVEVRTSGVPAGIGTCMTWSERLDGRLAQGLMAIQAVKGVEIGDGFADAALRGSVVHDEIRFVGAARRPLSGGFARPTNRAGGIEGGMTNGEEVCVRAAMKPIATLVAALPSADLRTGAPGRAAVERSDVCAVPALSVVAESVVALVVAQAFHEKFSGDTIGEIRRGFDAHLRAMARRPGKS